MSHRLKVGDILYYDWGYDQTNVNFYQVIGVTAKTVMVREIEAESVSPPKNMTDRCVARRDVFKGDSQPTRKVVQGEDEVHFAHGTGYLWDGTPRDRSWYA